MNDSQEVFVRLRTKFQNIYRKVREIHEEIVSSGKETVGGHGFDHSLMVAQYGVIIAEEDKLGEMAWIAGLLHSFDRHFSPYDEQKCIEECLSLVGFAFNASEIAEISCALANHSYPNDPMDSPLTIVLKDADRLGNLGAQNIFRGAQHRPKIPAVIPEYIGTKHPESQFKSPKSCYDALWFNLEWEDMLRTRKAKELAKRHFDFIRMFMVAIAEQYQEVGLYPWPAQ